MSTDHIVKSFDQALEQLKKSIVQMGGLAERQLDQAMECLVKRDTGLAAAVIEADAELDGYENEVDQAAIRFLALRQPMASDLREVLSALKIAADLERIGDYSANLAKRAIALSQVPPMRTVGALAGMAKLVQEIVKEVLDAYIERDLSRALDAWRRDEEVDDLYTSLFREMLELMMEDPRNITPSTHLLFAAKNIERIGDHATNIAETVHFLIEGQHLARARPKRDVSSFEVVSPADVTEEVSR